MKRCIILIIILILLSAAGPAWAFWVWTPETNKWVNPKYAVKETPAEQLAFALDFYKNKDYKEAIKELKKLLKHYPRAREAPEAQFMVGQILEEQGKLYEAFRQYQIVIDKYPFSELSGKIVQKQFDMGVRILEGDNSRGKIMDALDLTSFDVVEIFRAVIKNAPYGKLAPLSYYKIGLYLQEKRMFQEARDEFEKIINDYPESEWAKAAKYQIALSDAKRSTEAQYDQKITSSAVAEFNEFLEAYPDAELSVKAKDQIHQLKEKEAENNFLIAEFYEKQKNYSSAKIYYQEVIDGYEQSTWAPKALNRIREITMRENNSKKDAKN